MARRYARDSRGRFAGKGYSGQTGGTGARLKTPGKTRAGGGAKTRGPAAGAAGTIKRSGAAKPKVAPKAAPAATTKGGALTTTAPKKKSSSKKSPSLERKDGFTGRMPGTQNPGSGPSKIKAKRPGNTVNRDPDALAKSKPPKRTFKEKAAANQRALDELNRGGPANETPLQKSRRVRAALKTDAGYTPKQREAQRVKEAKGEQRRKRSQEASSKVLKKNLRDAPEGSAAEKKILDRLQRSSDRKLERSDTTVNKVKRTRTAASKGKAAADAEFKSNQAASAKKRAAADRKEQRRADKAQRDYERMFGSSTATPRPKVSSKTTAGKSENALRRAIDSGDKGKARSAYLKAMQANHPDRGGTEAAAKRINAEWKTFKERNP